MRRLLIGDRKMRVRDEGDAAGRPPVVLVHGAGASSVVWMDAVKRLAPLRRAVAPDLPGHGQSDPWHDDAGAAPRAVSLDLYRDAVGTACATLQLSRVVLVGHSMGGLVALRCALAWPERVAGLVLVGTGARMKVGPELYGALEHHYADFREWFGRVGYSPSTPREVVERACAPLFTCEQAVALADFRACDGQDLRAEVPRLRMPALVVGGADDLLMPPKLAGELAALLPNARAVILQHTGHMPFQEQPDPFHQELERFLREVP